MIKSIDVALQDGRMRRDILAKFQLRCERLDVPSNPLTQIDTPCILCRGPSSPAGYKLFNAQNKQLGYSISVFTHVVAYLLFKGPRGNQQVQHLCGVKYCANYEHLILGMHPQNAKHASKTRAKSVPTNKTWKLSEPDKIKIKTLRLIHNYPIDMLCEMFEVSQSTINRIIKS